MPNKKTQPKMESPRDALSGNARRRSKAKPKGKGGNSSGAQKVQVQDIHF